MQRVRFNPRSLESTTQAAKRLVEDSPLYIYATAFGFTIESTPPPFSQLGVMVNLDGSTEAINTVPPWERY